MPSELVAENLRRGGAAGRHCFAGASGAPGSGRRGAGVLGLPHGGAPLSRVRSPSGAALRQVAELPGGEWAAMLGWSPGAFKVGAQERWLGWLPEQQFRQLHLIASNVRILVLPGFRVPNLASRVARRLSSDMEALRGHQVLLAGTFVDPALFAGTCYRAAGWTEIGEMRGFGRAAGGWREHGRPKKVLVRLLRPGAAAPSPWTVSRTKWPPCRGIARPSASCASGRSPAPGKPPSRPSSAFPP